MQLFDFLLQQFLLAADISGQRLGLLSAGGKRFHFH